MGIYDHYVPAVVDAVLQRGEFLTAYHAVPAGAEPGVLQAIFEYQTAICELTAMDVSNASGYDGTTVAADACLVAKHATGRAKVVLAETLSPQVRQVVKTYAVCPLEVVEVPHTDGLIDPGAVRDAAEDAAAVLFQQPNVFGILENALEPPAAAAKDAGALAVAHVDPVSLSVLEAPGTTAPTSRSARVRVRATISPTPARTTASSPRRRSTRGGCPPDHRRDHRPQRRPRLRADAADASSTSAARRRRRT